MGREGGSLWHGEGGGEVVAWGERLGGCGMGREGGCGMGRVGGSDERDVEDWRE